MVQKVHNKANSPGPEYQWAPNPRIAGGGQWVLNPQYKPVAPSPDHTWVTLRGGVGGAWRSPEEIARMSQRDGPFGSFNPLDPISAITAPLKAPVSIAEKLNLIEAPQSQAITAAIQNPFSRERLSNAGQAAMSIAQQAAMAPLQGQVSIAEKLNLIDAPQAQAIESALSNPTNLDAVKGGLESVIQAPIDKLDSLGIISGDQAQAIGSALTNPTDLEAAKGGLEAVAQAPLDKLDSLGIITDPMKQAVMDPVGMLSGDIDVMPSWGTIEDAFKNNTTLHGFMQDTGAPGALSFLMDPAGKDVQEQINPILFGKLGYNERDLTMPVFEYGDWERKLLSPQQEREALLQSHLARKRANFQLDTSAPEAGEFSGSLAHAMSLAKSFKDQGRAYNPQIDQLYDQAVSEFDASYRPTWEDPSDYASWYQQKIGRGPDDWMKNLGGGLSDLRTEEGGLARVMVNRPDGQQEMIYVPAALAEQGAYGLAGESGASLNYGFTPEQMERAQRVRLGGDLANAYDLQKLNVGGTDYALQDFDADQGYLFDPTQFQSGMPTLTANTESSHLRSAKLEEGLLDKYPWLGALAGAVAGYFSGGTGAAAMQAATMGAGLAGGASTVGNTWSDAANLENMGIDSDEMRRQGVTGGLSQIALSQLLQGQNPAVQGAAQGATSTAIQGGDFGDVLKGSAYGGLVGYGASTLAPMLGGTADPQNFQAYATNMAASQAGQQIMGNLLGQTSLGDWKYDPSSLGSMGQFGQLTQNSPGNLNILSGEDVTDPYAGYSLGELNDAGGSRYYNQAMGAMPGVNDYGRYARKMQDPWAQQGMSMSEDEIVGYETLADAQRKMQDIMARRYAADQLRNQGMGVGGLGQMSGALGAGGAGGVGYMGLA